MDREGTSSHGKNTYQNTEPVLQTNVLLAIQRLLLNLNYRKQRERH